MFLNAPLRTPRPWQARALDWAVTRRNIALFMQMRLGKTLVAIRWAKHWLSVGDHALVVAPKTVLLAWEEELALEGFKAVLLEGSQEERLDTLIANQDRTWFLTNLEGLTFSRKGGPHLLSPLVDHFHWPVAILDESSEIRNPRTLRVEACMALHRNSDHRAVLCGLPNPEGPEDFFNQMAFAYGSFMGRKNWYDFRELVCQPMPGGFGWSPTPASLVAVRRAVNEQAFCLTRKQAGIGNQKIYERRYVELPAATRRIYDQIEHDWAIGEFESMHAMEVFGWLSRLTGGRFRRPDGLAPEAAHHDAKFNELVHLFKTELKGEKAVVWFCYNDDLHACHDLLQKAGLTAATIDGHDGLATRRERIAAFRGPKCQLMLVQRKCARYGLDLSVADIEVFMEENGSCNDRMQAEDRIEHPTKKHSLLVIDLLARDTVDVDIRDSVRAKAQTASEYIRDVFAKVKARLLAKGGKRG